METTKQRRKRRTKLNCFPANLELNSQQLSELPDFVENCFTILEYFTLMLLNNTENDSETKLSYCYCYFNTVRWQLGNRSSSNFHMLIDIAQSLIMRLQSSFELLCSPTAYRNMSSVFSKSRCLVRSILPKYNISKKKTRRRCKTYRRTEEVGEAANSAEFLNKLYWTLFRTDSRNRTATSLSVQHIVDQMYLQIRATLSENCIDDADIWKELSVCWRSKGAISNIDNDIQHLQQKCQLLNMPEYQNFPWSGDCPTIDDCQDIFPDQFNEFVCLDNLDVDIASLTRKIFTSKNTFTLKNGIRSDSELDEGFSESEFVHDVDDKSVDNEVESCELLACEEFYCTDYHYNSSNSKDIKHRKDILTSVRSADHLSNDDEDSDGGTELLNIVNDSLNQFNYFMHHPAVSITDSDLPNKTAESQPIVCHSDFSSSSPTPVTGLLSPTAVHTSKDDTSPCISSVNSNVHPYSLSSYDVISKLFVSPVAIQNWYAYNSSPPCAATNSNSPIITVNNYCTGSTKIGSNWLPVISHNLVSTGQYIFGNGHQQLQHNNSRQQSFHRIILSPHLPLAPGNIGSQMQRGIVHLPQQLFHQLTEPHGMTETDCYEHRQLTVNPQSSPYSTNPNNNNSSIEYSAPPGAVTNSNCSNFTAAPAVHTSNITPHIKSCLDKSQRACCFYMRGGCKKEDCEYAHDLSKVTCKFWEKGDCFKSDTCPFKHGYMKT